jgi:hypothetical protein
MDPVHRKDYIRRRNAGEQLQEARTQERTAALQNWEDCTPCKRRQLTCVQPAAANHQRIKCDGCSKGDRECDVGARLLKTLPSTLANDKGKGNAAPSNLSARPTNLEVDRLRSEVDFLTRETRILKRLQRAIPDILDDVHSAILRLEKKFGEGTPKCLDKINALLINRNTELWDAHDECAAALKKLDSDL